jgi:hypothetical protein
MGFKSAFKGLSSTHAQFRQNLLDFYAFVHISDIDFGEVKNL